MPRYMHPDVQENGPAHIKEHCDALAVISSYTAGANWAAVNGALLAEVAMVEADFTFADGPNGSRELLTAGNKVDESANASGSGVNLHVAYLDKATSRVLYVTPAPANRTVTQGQPCAITAGPIQIPQPEALA